MSNKVVSVCKLKKTFDGNLALNDVSFEINKGEIFGFLGPSGSGKTTTINILTGQIRCDAGNAKMFGESVDNIQTELLERIGIVSDHSGYYEKLTLYKNLELYAKLYGHSKKVVDDLLKKVNLFDSKDKLVDELSTGMKQRMLLARALINKPDILFLDEPTSGLDPTTSKKIHKLLFEIKKQGTTIFLTTHDMDEATLLCDNLVLLNKGKIVEKGNPREIIERYNTDKKVVIHYITGEKEITVLEKINPNLLKHVATIHSCEPTLEDIFIKLTGDKLNEKD